MALDELVIPRTEASYAPEVIQWSDHGSVLVIGNTDLIILDPKKPSAKQVTSLSQLLKVSKLRQLLQLQNNYLESAISLDDDQSVQSVAEITVTKAFWSPGGVTKDAGCLIVVLTNTMQAFVIVQDSDWSIVEDLSQVLKRRFEVNFDNFVKHTVLEKLRIRSFAWSEVIPQENGFTIPLGCFCAIGTGSHEVLVYHYKSTFEEEVSVTIEGLAEGDYPKDIKWSPWVSKGGKFWSSQLQIISSQNCCVLKELSYSQGKLEVSASQVTLLVPSRTLVSASSWLENENTLFLSIVKTNALIVYVIDTKFELKSYEIPLDTYRAITNVSVSHSLGLNIVLSNSSGNLIFAHLIDEKLTKSTFDYQKGQLDFLPISGLANELVGLQKKHGSGYRIAGMTTNPAKNLLAFHYTKTSDDSLLSQHNTWRLDFSFRVVPLSENDWSHELLNTKAYPCTRYSPLFKIQQLEILKGSGVFGNLIMDKLQGFDDRIEIPKQTSESLSRKLQSFLFQSDVLAKLQLKNVFNGDSTSPQFIETKKKILSVIAQMVVSSCVPDQLTHPADLMIYNSMVMVLKPGSVNNAKVSLEEPEFELTEKFGFNGFDVDVAISDEGHEWVRCAYTLLPLMTPQILQCTFCESKMTAAAEAGYILESIRKALVLCPYCGSSFSRKGL
ncbi:unnamed protein product [Kuraishia capsulata CBS 1993]|uniref:Transcription factor IIIC putative zinc-finger domain-containing protein n=1 Tax=Kuraishia capsulata CBS 1993 TaxID=1382522 RepID=W6MQB5_9ASCO|nr:uncharacterized protein KUCA_T00000045001 [Kuraishia capsulata CBS 1993]CDK24085.1 unnamed protein product [Kuraishia capsulata CBS 1993]